MKPQCSGMPTTWTVLPSQIIGLIRLVTYTLAFTEPRFDQTRTQPALAMPFFLGQLFADLDEEFRLERSIDLAVLGPIVEVLGQPVGGCRVGELLGVAELLHVAFEHARHRIALILGLIGLAIGDSNGS